VIRLVLTPCDHPHRGKYDAMREDTGEHICRSHQPLCDGARALIQSGEAPQTLITMRHVGATYDSFEPAPLAPWAAKTIGERRREGLRQEKWRPYDGPGRNMPRQVARYDRTATLRVGAWYGE
jgi:hypothetical protein